MPRTAVLALALALEFAAAGRGAAQALVTVVDASLTREGPRTLVHEFTLRYTGSPGDWRLYEGRYLRLFASAQNAMEEDVLVDDPLGRLGAKEIEWEPPMLPSPRRVRRVVREAAARGPVAEELEGELLWDVVASPVLVGRSRLVLRRRSLEASRNGLFRHEAMDGHTSWGGRLHRETRFWSWSPGDVVDREPHAAYWIGDEVYGLVVRTLPSYLESLALKVQGKTEPEPDLFDSSAEVYLIGDLRFSPLGSDSLRLVWETNRVSLEAGPRGDVGPGTGLFGTPAPGPDVGEPSFEDFMP